MMPKLLGLLSEISGKQNAHDYTSHFSVLARGHLVHERRRRICTRNYLSDCESAHQCLYWQRICFAWIFTPLGVSFMICIDCCLGEVACRHNFHRVSFVLPPRFIVLVQNKNHKTIKEKKLGKEKSSNSSCYLVCLTLH